MKLILKRKLVDGLYGPDIESLPESLRELVGAVQRLEGGMYEVEVNHPLHEEIIALQKRVARIEHRIGLIEQAEDLEGVKDAVAQEPEVADFEVGELVYPGQLRRYNEIVYRVITGHITQADWTPDVVPALWLAVQEPLPGDDYPPWIQPTGAHDAYNMGDRVTHEGQNWESTANANVWEPGIFGWIVIT